jgi:hypothetical protein
MSSAQKYADLNKNQHFSDLLRHFLAQHQEDEIYVRDLLHEMGDRAFGPTLLICALPEALPLPMAGMSAFVGIPLILVSTQLVIGFRQPWLPHWLLKRSFKRQHFEKLVRKALHLIEKLEKALKPRWQFFTNPTFERLIGLLLLFLAVIIALPIPFANMVPAIVIALICLGMIERDGVVIAISSVMIFAILVLSATAIIAVIPLLKIP